MNFKYLTKSLKINHYIKNIVVFLPLFFSLNLTNYNLWLKEGIMFSAFCLMSSCVYILNDLVDFDMDKTNPEKSNSPILTGLIPQKQAKLIIVVLFCISLFFGLNINIYCAIALLSYLILNIFYSLKLKTIFFVDVLCIALGFIIRMLSGCVAIWVAPPVAMIFLVLFVSMFFTFIKRKLELHLIQDLEKVRLSLKNCSEMVLNILILIMAVLSIAFYSLYILNDKFIVEAGIKNLNITIIPFALIFLRLISLVNQPNKKYNPIYFIENDAQLKLLIISFFALLIMMLH